MNLELHEAMRTLAGSRAVFHSEPDFQHALAWSIQSAYPTAKVRLEVPLESPNGELDVLIGVGVEQIGIELKYVRANLGCTVDGETFRLSKSPLPPSRYGFWSDLSRLEQWVATNQLTRGFALVLSNCGGCWSQSTQATTQDAINFHDNLTVRGTLTLDERPNSTRVFSPIALKGTYRCEWREFATIGSEPNSRFRYLLLEASPGLLGTKQGQ